MNDTEQTFKVETENGEIKEAKLLNVISNNDNEYAVYAIDNGNDTSNLYASKIIVDANGQSKLIDLEENEEKIAIIKIIKEMLNK
jgi:hypothetical protein